MNDRGISDGFRAEIKFYCKELGIVKVGDAAAHSFFFDIRLIGVPRGAKKKEAQILRLFTSAEILRRI